MKGGDCAGVGYVIVLGVWWNVIDDLVLVLVLSRLCYIISGVICRLPVGFWWSVKTSLRMGAPKEQDGAVVCVSWTLPSGLSSGPFCALNTHFQL